MKRANTKVGDIFSATLDSNTKQYLQYISSDLSQLNSDVVRVFSRKYHLDYEPDLPYTVNDKIAFYAHCVTKWGINLGLWEKVGNFGNIGSLNVLFRDTGDLGNPEIKISNDWWIWKVNQKQKWVGKLKGKNKKAEIGLVFSPVHSLERMRTGYYDVKYPDFE